MATYFHGEPEIQPDGLQTLYLMNPSYVSGYSDATAAPAAQQASMVFVNSPLSSLTSISQHHHQQQQQQHFFGIPLQPPSNEPNRPPPSRQTTSIQYNIVDIQSRLGPRRPGLSLSLSPQQAQFAAASGGVEEARFVEGYSSSNGPAGVQSVLMGSKYLKAAQQLLDEVVSVGRGEAAAAKANDSSSKIATKSTKDGDGDGDGNGKKAAELTTAERQELQTKKAKLVNMHDEVEQRYRQYQHQMQIVVSSMETVAGIGSAKTYTALALQTISKQFRCLRDAISGQIRATSKRLGEEECMAGAGGGSKSVGSRLRFVDHQLRQQRALQQLGMIHHNAWRPQRGLPERAVSVLRAWLFEHFLHPYPKDSDKHMLAKQTGLTRSQVSNWFINARVRLWKPMVEEMYLEETKEQRQNSGGDDKISEASEHSASKSTSQRPNSNTPSRTEQTDNNPPMEVPSSDMAMFDNRNDGAIMQQIRLKKQRSDVSLHQNAIAANQMSMEMKPYELRNRELLMKFMDQGAGFGAYPIGEIGRFDHEQFAPRFAGNGVSLTLGLPHCETLSLSGSQAANYLSNESMHLGRGLELSSEENYFSLSNNNSNIPSASNAYESINTQNRRRFAAQLLPDFVA